MTNIVQNFMRGLRKALPRSLGSQRTYTASAFQIPRAWSNDELRKFSHHFRGSVVNVSAWEDKDKSGGHYRDYFANCSSYSITNFGTSQGILQGVSNEIYLDLEVQLPNALRNKYDVVFNHTTLEHIWDFRTAFTNICDLSSDIVIIVLPWLQPQHADYGDYWRFSPSAIARLFEERGLVPLYISWNETKMASVYLFAIAAKFPGNWSDLPIGPPVNTSHENLVQTPVNTPGRASFQWALSSRNITRQLR